jgi:hypothetical protein
MRIIDVFYQLSYFLSLNNINGNIQGWREYSTRCPPVFLTYVGAGPWPAFAGVGPFAPAIVLGGVSAWHTWATDLRCVLRAGTLRRRTTVPVGPPRPTARCDRWVRTYYVMWLGMQWISVGPLDFGFNLDAARCCVAARLHHAPVLAQQKQLHCTAVHGVIGLKVIRPCGLVSRCLQSYRRNLLQLLRASRASVPPPASPVTNRCMHVLVQNHTNALAQKPRVRTL